MSKPYAVRCLDSKYDEKDEMLILYCRFLEIGEDRIIQMARQDFHQGSPGNEVSHFEMHKTAALWKGKLWTFYMEDDPNRNKLSEQEQKDILSTFNKKVVSDLENSVTGYAEDSREINRRLERLKNAGKIM